MKDASKLSTKYKPFQYYQEKYFHRLREPNSLIEPLNMLCGGWSLQTFNQVISKLSANRSSPLPLYFPTSDSMELISKNKTLVKQVFKFFDTRELGRIDSSEVYCALMIISKGAYETFLRAIVEVFGFEFQGRILKQEFFFFLDSLFRAIPKIVVIKDYDRPTETNVRLDFKDINELVEAVFGDKEEIERNQIYESFIQHKELNEFIKYIQKRCTLSAESCRNETIERVSIEAEVRGCVIAMVERIDRALRTQELENILQ